MAVQPYLFFEGRCEEAIEFYRKALGAEVRMIMRYRESPDQRGMPPGIDPNKVMHAALKIGDSEVMASDGMCNGRAAFQGFGLALPVANDADAKRRFDALAEGGQVRAPLTKTFFASSFGMVSDRFGVLWMVIAEEPHR